MLRRLAVRNWRAFGSANVTFRPGVNVLLGPNGAGKTSLLEAATFALAGEPSTISDVRQMARANGPVDVALALDLDGTEWEIARALGPTHRRGSENVRRGGQAVAEGSASVASTLADLFGVPSEFFLRILYMPEGDVYRFLGNSSPLTLLDDHLRRVLGLEQLAAIEKAATQVKREVTAARGKLTTAAEQAAGRDQILTEGRTRWSGDLAEQRRILEAEGARLTAELATVTEERRAAEDAVHRIDRTCAELAEIEREHRELSAGGDATQQLRDLRQRGAALAIELQGLQEKFNSLAQEQKLQADRRQMLASRTATDLATGDAQLRAHLARATEAVGALDRELAAVATETEVATRRGRTLQGRAPADLIADDPELRERRDARDLAIRQIDDDLAAASSERQSLAESTQFLESHAPGASVDAVCPVCRQPLPEALRLRLLAENAARVAALDERDAAARSQRATLVTEGRAEAEALKQRLVQENAEALDALTARTATLRRQRSTHQNDLEAEVTATRERLLAEHDAQARTVEDQLRVVRVERQAAQAAHEHAERQGSVAFQRERRIRDLAEKRAALLPGNTTPEILHERRARLAADAAVVRERESAVVASANAVRQELSALQGYLRLAVMEGHDTARRAALARRELLAELFVAATTETLRRLREGALDEAYRAVEQAWADFSGWTDAEIAASPKGRLSVRHDGRDLDLAQLSGGERAAFLVLLHAHLGHRFGRGSFLLLDEPLEHLDAANGRRMLQCLLQACNDGLLSQIVLATVEADVVQAVVRDGDAHVIDLTRQQPGVLSISR